MLVEGLLLRSPKLCCFQDLEVSRSGTLAAESLASMPVSLRRLVLQDCFSVPTSSLASIKRLSALEELALHCLPEAGGDAALQLLALQLPAGLTSLEFSDFSKCKVSAVPSMKGADISVDPDLPAIEGCVMFLSLNGCICVAAWYPCRRTPGA